MVVQAILKSGTTWRTCWIPAERCKRGDRITLKNSEDKYRLWDVVSFGHPHEASEIKQDYHGSRVE